MNIDEGKMLHLNGADQAVIQRCIGPENWDNMKKAWL